MKSFILFIGLFLLLSVNVNAQSTCEEHYNVTLCNECLTEIWNLGNSPSSCDFYFHLFGELKFGPFAASYDLATYNETITRACSAEFSCTYEESKQYWGSVETKCANELTTHVDWESDPENISHAIISPYGALIAYFFAVPEHNSICHKDSSGGKFILQFRIFYFFFKKIYFFTKGIFIKI